jgi:parallel beta-helix repeat protein
LGRSRISVLVAFAVAAVVISACSSGDTSLETSGPSTSLPAFEPMPTTAECLEVVSAAAQRLQDVIDTYQEMSIVEFNALEDPIDVTPIQALNQESLQTAADAGCPIELLEEEFAGALGRLSGRGELGQALAAALRGDDPPLGPPLPILVNQPFVPLTECRTVVDVAAGRLQSFVDRYQDLSVEEYAALDPEPDASPIIDAIRVDLQAAADSGCAAEFLNTRFAGAVRGLTGSGPVGGALAAALRGEEPIGLPLSPVGLPPAVTISLPPATTIVLPTPTTVAPSAADDLVAIVGGLAPGSRIELAAGRYTLSGPLVIDKSITLVGAGRGRSTIATSTPGAAVIFLGPGTLELRSLSLLHSGAVDASLLLAVRGAVTIDDVAMSGAKGSLAEGTGSALVFGFDPIDGLPSLTAAQRGGALTVRNSSFTGNAGAGVMAIGPAAPSISASTFRSNGACGVCFVSTSSGTVIDSTFVDNRLGVQASGTSRPILRRNDVRGSDVGVRLGERAVVTVDAGRFVGNEVGVQADTDTTANVTANTFRDHEVAAVVMVDRAGGRIAANTVERAGLAGIQLLGESGAEVVDNVVDGPAPVCLSVLGAVRSALRGNTVSGCDVGIQVSGTARPDLVGNAIRRSTSTGLSFNQEARGTARDNTVDDSVEVGIQVSGNAGPAVTANRVSSSQGVGIVYWNRSSGRVSNNTVAGHRIGLQVGEESTATFTGNTVSGASGAALIVTGTSAPTLQDNQLTSAGDVVAQFDTSSAALFTDNVVTGSVTTGLLYLGAAGGTASGNRIAGPAAGVEVGGTSAPSILANRFESNSRAAMIFTGSSAGQVRDNVCASTTGSGIVLSGQSAPQLGGNQCSIQRSG